MKSAYAQPKWAITFNEFYKKFCNSLRALFDLLWNIGGSIAIGSGIVAEKLFSVAGNALDPVIAARIFILGASLVIAWGLYSWGWVGIALGAFLGVPSAIAWPLGLLAGALLNIAEILPKVGKLFQEYADVLGRAGKEAEARNWDKAGISAGNFLGYSYSRLNTFRNVSFIIELLGSGIYKFVTGGFTKTVLVKGVAIVKPLAFWQMMGSISWCLALVKLPEIAIEAAAAAVHVAAQLPDRRS